ncbi:hypothetical protein C8N43_0010 [Litoreibacter ponti]|uniref:YD repeat-containing protein n=1 Tax=Litoreibacter ponti TaxID=1510457 RepID=A0A2T6BH47_9RHOB|nr:hypothetical protein [Litoreibacter ponti]PTX55377.1 hypothetical protein C8N43_0010 [Litoreibacter ponti]
MKKLMTLAVIASCALGAAAQAKTVTYIETVTRADGTRIVTITKVQEPSLTVTKASLNRSLLRSNLR